MIDPLEPRRLYAASATLVNGTLGVVGTDGSDRISIAASYSVSPNTVLTRASAAAATHDADNFVVRVIGYDVTVNDHSLGSFAADQVKRVNVFALGGNDRVIGPPDMARSIEDTGSGSIASVIVTRAAGLGATPIDVTPVFAPMYVEGGSGRDFIQGASGNDTLKGGRGDDVLIGGAGRNVLNGGAGDDAINALLVPVDGSEGKKVLTRLDADSRNTVIGGAGRDFATLGRFDTPSDDLESRGYVAANVLANDNGTPRGVAHVVGRG